MNILVTKKSNVTFFEEDNTSTENFSLVNDKDVGFLRKVHTLQTVLQDENGVTHHGFVTRCEVYWELHRSPALSMEDPLDLVWLSMDSIEETDDSEIEDEADSEADDFDEVPLNTMPV